MNDKNSISVSIVIPSRNEKKYIERCLDSIFKNDFSKGNLEVLVVDGMSEDGTRELVSTYLENHSSLKLVDNPAQKTAEALNLGIKKSKGKYVAILSSHSKIGTDFIKANIDNLNKYAVDCVGGVMKTIPADKTLSARAIAFALSHPFGVGNSYFRVGIKDPKFVDTVPFGCYRKEVFNKIGYFDENLVRNQDLEFNLRLKKAGGQILLAPNIISYYHARANLIDLFKQNFANGYWVIYGLRFCKMPFSLRHLVPFVFVFALLSSFMASLIYSSVFYVLTIIVSLYLTCNIFSSFKLSSREGLENLPFLVITFATLHFSYGAGSLCGMFRP